MPPEPPPWDRKEFVSKDRKHERGAGYETLGGGGGGGGGSSSSSAPRWREVYHAPRDFPRASPRRPPPGHYRQGSCYNQPHGEASRPGDRFWPEGESFRPSFFRHNSSRSSGGGGRENRGYFRRSPYGDSGDFSRPNHDQLPATAPRSIAVSLTLPAPQAQAPSRETQEKAVDSADDGPEVDDGGAAGKKTDQNDSLGSILWKPLKWSRSGSFSSLKTARSEMDDSGLDTSLPSGKETPIRSPGACTQEVEDGVLKRKQRLGWGQGLAKYEKQKAGVSEDVPGKNGLIPCANGSKSTLGDTSPKVAGCPSPVTPCSIACSSSPGMEDKPCAKGESNSDFGDSSLLSSQNCTEEFSIKLEHFEVDPINTLSKLLADFMQPEDSCSGDSTFGRHAAMSKLLLLKDDISKELEKTEYEIDLFENELKYLECEGKNDACRTSLALSINDASNRCGKIADGTSMVLVNSASLKDQMLASAVTLAMETLDQVDANVKYVDGENSETIPTNSVKLSSTKGTSDDWQVLAVSPVIEDVKLKDEMQDFVSPPAGCTPEDEKDASHADLNRRSHVSTSSNLIGLIMPLEESGENRALEVLSKVSPPFDYWNSDKLPSLRKNDMHIKKKLAARKRLFKFKERLLALRFRVFHHLWTEDLRLLSMKKCRPKSQKRIEPSCRLTQSSSQKHRSSIRSRSPLPGNLTLVPTTEIVQFTSKLLSDSKVKIYRKDLKMPAYILDEERNSMFVTKNQLIEDPIVLENEKALINVWKQDEIEVFMKMLATLGKNFRKIASFLEHKTTADCVEFYYKNHKSDSFREVREHLALRKQCQSLPSNTYLLTSGKKWQHEENAASLDLLGAVSVVAAQNNESTRSQHKFDRRSNVGNYTDFRMPQGDYVSEDRAESVGYCRKETTAADVLAGICGALSSEAMSSCITSSISAAEKMNYMICELPSMPGVTQSIDEETCSEEVCDELDSVDWTDDEKTLFIQALSIYGKDFARISRCVPTRTKEQCKIFFSKARKSLGLDIIYQGPCDGATPRSDTNGGRSDMDDAFATEMDSAVCSTQSCSRVDVEFTQSVGNTSREDTGHAASERLEAVGQDQEEIETKADVFVSPLKEDGLLELGDSSQPAAAPHDIGDGAVSCKTPGKSGGVAEFCADTAPKQNCSHPAGWSSSRADIPADEVVECLTSQTVEKAEQQNNDEHCLSVKVKHEPEVQELQAGLDGGQAMDPCANEIVACPGNKVNACPSPAFSPNFLHPAQQDVLPSPQKNHFIPVKEDTSLSVSVLPDPSSIPFRDHGGLQSNPTFEEHVYKQHQNLVNIKFYQQCLRGNSSLAQVRQALHVLKGYPLQVLDQRAIKREPDIIGGRAVLQENYLDRDGISPLYRLFDLALPNKKCNGSKSSDLKAEMHPSSRSRGQSDGEATLYSQTSCVENDEQSQQTGDVKLFGKILTNPASSQKANLTSQDSYSKHSSSCQKGSTNFNLSGNQKDENAVATTPQHCDNSGLDDLAARSYGFWGGSRKETGFAALAEPAVLLDKCQGPLAGVSFCPARDSHPCRNGVVVGNQHAYSQPLSSGGVLPTFQQQARAVQRQGLNGDGGGSILVGGGVGASDPVAAHYAARTKVLASVSEMEAWKRGDR